MSDKSGWWAFDRPLLSDGLVWSGITLGVLFATYEMSSATFVDLPTAAKLVAVGTRLAAGFFLMGVFGGAVRNFWRGYHQVDRGPDALESDNRQRKRHPDRKPVGSGGSSPQATSFV